MVSIPIGRSILVAWRCPCGVLGRARGHCLVPVVLMRIQLFLQSDASIGPSDGFVVDGLVGPSLIAANSRGSPQCRALSRGHHVSTGGRGVKIYKEPIWRLKDRARKALEVCAVHFFTEQGVAMLSSVLNIERAVQVNIEVMRAFVRLRETVSTHKDLARKLIALESKYDRQIKVVFDAIRGLMQEPEPKRRGIGFTAKIDD